VPHLLVPAAVHLDVSLGPQAREFLVDLTDAQWAVLEGLLPKGKKPGRPPVWSRRQLIDGRAALRPDDGELPGDAWLSADADVLVPAAVSYAIDVRNQAAVTARWIAEAANMPVLPDAEELLAARGVTVLPDVVVNSATNAWWWWTLFGDIGPDADEAFAHIRRSVRALVEQVLTRAERDGTSPRVAAHGVVADRLPVIAERFGWYA